MYDISGIEGDKVEEALKADWQHLVGRVAQTPLRSASDPTHRPSAPGPEDSGKQHVPQA